jgi:hypothetical protein
VNATTDKLPFVFLGAAAGLTYWLWRREQNPTDPQELPEAPPPTPVSIQGPSFVEDNPADEILDTMLKGELSRRPYSLSYQDGSTTLYTRFVDDYSSVGELGRAEQQAWLNSLRTPTGQIQPQ